MRVCSNIIETPSWASYTIQAFCGVDFGLLKSLWSKVVDRDSAISGLKGRKAHRLLPDSVSDTKLCQETKHPASLQQYQIQMAFIKSTQNPTWYGCLFKNYFQFNTHDRTRGHEYYKKKFDLKQMSGSPVACKKNHEYLQKPKKQISAGTNTGPIHKQLNSILGWSMAK